MGKDERSSITWAYHSGTVGDSAPNHLFPVKDNRYDPLVGNTMSALHDIILKKGKPTTSTAVIAITDSGRLSHINRVRDGITEMRPRQAFFARGGPNMLASYGSMAMGSHGPCFSLSGGADAVRFGLDMAVLLLRIKRCEQIVLLAADYEDTAMNTVALLTDISGQKSLEDLQMPKQLNSARPSAIFRYFMDSRD